MSSRISFITLYDDGFASFSQQMLPPISTLGGLPSTTNRRFCMGWKSSRTVLALFWEHIILIAKIRAAHAK